MLAISTTWNYDNSSDIKEVLSEIKKVGLNTIEVGFNFTAERLKELTSLINAMDIKVVSVHNFCPLPPKIYPKRYIYDYYRISSLDENERKNAVEYTKGTIDTAKRFSAKAVIIHAGTVELGGNYTKGLIQLYTEGKGGSKYYNKLKEKFLKIREDKKRPYIDSTAKSLHEIISYASKIGIKIAIETRYLPEEIPNIEEIGYLLGLFDSNLLFYWHDVGHAEVNERLGITPHIDFLKRFSGRMLGMHIHGIRGLEDHLTPFSGDFDFFKIAPYIDKDLLNVIEAHSPSTLEDIRASIVRLSKLEF